MRIIPKIITNQRMRYVSHSIVDIMYHILTSTDICVIIRANDKVFWARNSSNPIMACLFYELVSMSIYGCIHSKFNEFLRYFLKINVMGISIEIK